MKQNKIAMGRTPKRGVAVLLALSVCLSAAGCKKEKKEEKPEPKKVVEVDDGNTNASKSGDGQSDAPFVIGTGKFTGSFNPFTAETEADRQVVELTQAELVQPDRGGKAVYHGIDGEYREYLGEHYTYYGTSDLEVSYDEVRKETKYHITLRKDLVFSDREVLNADDVIFTLYALCDNSYTGNAFRLKNMPVKGLLNYLADSTKAEAFSEKKVKKYIRKKPKKLKRWVETYIIKNELEQGFERCEKNFKAAGYETGFAYFMAKYRIPKKDQVMKKGSLLKKAFSYYKKKGYRVLAKNAHFRSDYYDARVMRQARIFLAKGKGKKVPSISGIVRVNDFEVEITTDGYDREMTAALNIPICPLHYYGDKEKYHYKKNQFGFRRGDISALKANKAMPMGAGAYRYIKLEDGVAYFTSNELYFLGCPKTAFVQVKEMSDVLAETDQRIKQQQPGDVQLKEDIAPEKDTEPAGEDAPAETEPAPTVNPSAELTELTAGTADMLCGDFSGGKTAWIAGLNSNEEISGRTVETRFTGDGNYFYLGLHAGNVSVGGAPKSSASKALRRALATVFAFSRDALLEKNGDAVLLPDYPALEESWVVSSLKQEEHEAAYNETLDGEYIYELDDDMEEKQEDVKEAVLECFKGAGFTLTGQKVTKAPQGAKLSYTLLLPAGEKNFCYEAVKRAAGFLKEMGITIRMKKVNGETALYRILKKGTQELWADCRSGSDAELLERYGKQAGKRIFGYEEKGLEGDLEKLRGYLRVSDRESVYRSCFQRIFDGVLEVPMCEFRTAVLYSAERIARKTIPKELTLYYRPVREIQKLEMK